jgi:lysophospholipase
LHSPCALPITARRFISGAITMQAALHETDDNPLPEGGQSGHVTGFDGIRCRYALFPHRGSRPRGTAILLQGRNECIEKYFETVRDLQRLGFGAALIDWRGQGGSDRLLRDPRRGHVDGFLDYVGDLERFFSEVVLPDCRGPYHILAHSTGALVALLAAPRLVNRVDRTVLCAPLLEFAGTGMSPASVERLAGTLYALGLGTMTMGGRTRRLAPAALAQSVLTSDPRRHARNAALFEAHPELFLGGPTVGWVRAAALAARAVRAPEFLAALRMPILIVAAGADRVVSTAAAERYGRALRTGSCVTIDGARHEILQEQDRYREQLLAAFDAFASTG